MTYYFFTIFVLSILTTRLILFLYPVSSPTIGVFRLHHYMYGILGIAIGLIIHSIIVYAIGMGGYILDTLSPDGDELDCYILTDKKFKTGDIIDCEPVGMEEWFEDEDEADHKILMVISGEKHEVTEDVKEKLRYFATHFFEHIPEKKWRQGEYYGKEKAEALIKKREKAYQNK